MMEREILLSKVEKEIRRTNWDKNKMLFVLGVFVLLFASFMILGIVEWNERSLPFLFLMIVLQGMNFLMMRKVSKRGDGYITHLYKVKKVIQAKTDEQLNKVWATEQNVALIKLFEGKYYIPEHLQYEEVNAMMFVFTEKEALSKMFIPKF